MNKENLKLYDTKISGIALREFSLLAFFKYCYNS